MSRSRASSSAASAAVVLLLVVLLAMLGAHPSSAAEPTPPVPPSQGGTSQSFTVEVPAHTIPTTSTGVGASGLLPRTGGVAPWLLQTAIGLIGAGVVLVVASRRGQRPESTASANELGASTIG
jgi:hypothetical protein